MQLAGEICAICRQQVLIETEATWCARCSLVFHRRCLNEAETQCPTCHQAYEAPEDRFVFCKVCPECFQPTSPPKPRCLACGARTRWYTQAAYQDFADHVKDASRVRLLRGLVELIGACLCLIALTAMVLIATRPGFGPLTLFLLGFMTLTADGLASIVQSRKLAKFR